MSIETNYRKDIQGLRGLAVLAVVLFHADDLSFPLGYLGVDVFFVISGFVVTPLILRIFKEQTTGGRISALRFFYKRRFFRLAPALAAILTISSVAIFLLGPTIDHHRFAMQGISTLLLIGNLGAYKYSADYFSSNPNPLVHTWSLSVEEQIYIFLPVILVLFVLNLTNLKKISSIVSKVLVFVTALSFISFLFPTILQPIYSRIGIDFASQFSFYSPVDRVWEFTIGGLLYLWLNRYEENEKKISRKFNLVLVVAALIALLGPFDINLKVSSAIASFITIIVIRFRSIDSLPNFLVSKLEWLGDRSYSIYLVHMPLIYLATYWLEPQTGVIGSKAFQSTIAVIASIALGALSYSTIENKYRNRGKTTVTPLRSISAALVLTFVIPLAFFALIDKANNADYWGFNKDPLKPPYAADLDPNCLRDSIAGQPCFYKIEGAKKTVLLIGDSHAGHISQAVVDAAANANWNSVIWAHSGCRIKFQDSIKTDIQFGCLENNVRMKSWVLKNKPDAIIVSQYVLEEFSQIDLRGALFKLHAIVPNILLIENNPIFPDQGKFKSPRALILPTYNPPKYFKRSEMLLKDVDAANRLAKWARNNGISTLNFDSLFCNDVICRRYSEAGWLYFDNNHLSVAGAELTIPQISAYLKKF